jgi:hypothetical protein
VLFVALGGATRDLIYGHLLQLQLSQQGEGRNEGCAGNLLVPVQSKDTYQVSLNQTGGMGTLISGGKAEMRKIQSVNQIFSYYL